MANVETKAKPKLVSTPFVMLACVNFLSALCYYLLLADMTDYAIVTYGVEYNVAALTVTSFVVGSLLARLLLGGRIDEWGIRRSLFLGYGICLVFVFFYFLDFGIQFLLVIRFLHGCGFALASTTAAAAVVLLVPEERRGEGISYFSMGVPLATGVGPFVALFLVDTFGTYNAVFIFTAIMCIITFVALFFLKLPIAASSKESGTSSKAEGATERKTFSLSSFIQYAVLPLGVVILLVYICYSGIMSFLITYAKDINLSHAAGYYFLLYAATVIVTRPISGRYIDRHGPNRIMIIATVSIAVGYVILANATNAVALLLSAVFIGFGVGNAHSTGQITVANITPTDQLGKANATYYIMIDVGTSIGPFLIGSLIPVAGYQLTFTFIAVFALIALALYVVLFMRNRK